MMEISVSTSNHREFIDITQKVCEQIPANFSGACLLYIPHTSAAVMINEGADPAVQSDSLTYLDKLIPWDEANIDHAEGNSAAHIKSMLIGNDQMIIVKSGKLQLGTWEKIFLCEFDGPRTRNVWIQLLTD